MPYCSKCREEFQDWVTMCPDCSVSLVDILPEPPVPKPESKEKPVKVSYYSMLMKVFHLESFLLDWEKRIKPITKL